MAKKVAQRPESLDILFVGNSFTARNNVPGMIAKLAAAKGTTITHRLISAGGAALRQHWNKGDAQRAMESTRYDWVVLQEQSTLPVKNALRMHESVRLFDEAIRASGARTMLYMTWARQLQPENQFVIQRAYESIGQELGATVVPAGLAWERFLAQHSEPALHDKDGSHPTLAGSYLAACVFFETLLGESVVANDTAIPGLKEEDARLLRMAASRDGAD